MAPEHWGAKGKAPQEGPSRRSVSLAWSPWTWLWPRGVVAGPAGHHQTLSPSCLHPSCSPRHSPGLALPCFPGLQGAHLHPVVHQPRASLCHPCSTSDTGDRFFPRDIAGSPGAGTWSPWSEVASGLPHQLHVEILLVWTESNLLKLCQVRGESWSSSRAGQGEGREGRAHRRGTGLMLRPGRASVTQCCPAGSQGCHACPRPPQGRKGEKARGMEVGCEQG